MFKDFISLLFPDICLSCGRSLFHNEWSLCTVCLYHLPQTHYHLLENNPIIRLFWGRSPVFSAAACFQFSKGGNVQHLIHQLKYKGRKELGIGLGRFYGRELKQSPYFKGIDMILPVPLHQKKLRKRGYNQSDFLAEGLAQGLNVPYDTKLLYRAFEGESQTKKSRFERWENVRSIFGLKDRQTLEHKHVLLADDVVTTGSTFEACTQPLLQVQGIKVSVAAIAYTPF